MRKKISLEQIVFEYLTEQIRPGLGTPGKHQEVHPCLQGEPATKVSAGGHSFTVLAVVELVELTRVTFPDAK